MSNLLAQFVLCVGVGALLSPCASMAQTQGLGPYVKVKAAGVSRIVPLRSGPARAFKRIGFLPPNARRIRNFGCKQLVTGNWCELSYRGTRGWALRRYLVADRARLTSMPFEALRRIHAPVSAPTIERVLSRGPHAPTGVIATREKSARRAAMAP
jgi:uncharacterized protein YraI